MYLSGSISFGVDSVSGKAVEYRERVILSPQNNGRCTTIAAKRGGSFCKTLNSARHH